jgi:hypothetical protein
VEEEEEEEEGGVMARLTEKVKLRMRSAAAPFAA